MLVCEDVRRVQITKVHQLNQTNAIISIEILCPSKDEHMPVYDYVCSCEAMYTGHMVSLDKDHMVTGHMGHRSHRLQVTEVTAVT